MKTYYLSAIVTLPNVFIQSDCAGIITGQFQVPLIDGGEVVLREMDKQ